MTLARMDRLGRLAPGWVRDGHRRRSMVGTLGLGLAVAAPICAVLTYVLLSRAEATGETSVWLRGVLILDFVLAIALLGVIAWRIAMLVLARRARSAGSRLHLRMVRLFTIIAVAPAILLGLFAAVTVTYSLEGWLNKRVAGVVENSVAIAEGYVRERHQRIRLDASVIAGEVARAAPFGVIEEGRMNAALARASRARGLVEVYVIDSSGEILARGPSSYLFLFEPPSDKEFAATRPGEVYVFEDRTGGAVRALLPLSDVFDSYLYLVRPVDGEAMSVLADTRRMAAEYDQLEDRRDDLQILFAMLYLGFALLVLSAAIWFGIWFADRLARPISRLAGAADRVAKGDLTARVQEEKGDDEIAVLSRAFNRMTGQVQRQRDALVDANVQLDERRRFTEAVLSGVTVGVLRLDAAGRVDLANASARKLLATDGRTLEGRVLPDAFPAFAKILDAARDAPGHVAEGRALVPGEGGESDFLVRVAGQMRGGALQGYVVTLDDMTELVSAQRLAAWSDVARRVAHEIRNPLTPIQLSAERLRRKFADRMEGERDHTAFIRCTETIGRQVEQIRRMVEEFSNFARMPEPVLAPARPGAILAEAVGLQATAAPDVAFDVEGVDLSLTARCDAGLLAQAFTNILKNAVEAIAMRREEQEAAGVEPQAGRIHLALRPRGKDGVVIEVTDNGNGLPAHERKQVMEPYVTTKKKGTGLGLAIVRRIAEEHGGSLALHDAPGEGGATGTRVRMTLAHRLEGADAPAAAQAAE